jgi:hypothetical protein
VGNVTPAEVGRLVRVNRSAAIWLSDPAQINVSTSASRRVSVDSRASRCRSSCRWTKAARARSSMHATRVTSWAWSNGLKTKSTAPARIAQTAVDTSEQDERNATQIGARHATRRLWSSNPLIPLRCTSSNKQPTGRASQPRRKASAEAKLRTSHNAWREVAILPICVRHRRSVLCKCNRYPSRPLNRAPRRSCELT